MAKDTATTLDTAPDTVILITEALITKESIPAAAFSVAKVDATSPSWLAGRRVACGRGVFRCSRKKATPPPLIRLLGKRAPLAGLIHLLNFFDDRLNKTDDSQGS